MANHSYTFAQLKAAAKNAAGITATGTDFDTGNPAADVVNDALQHLAGERVWTWLRRPLILNVTATAAASVARASDVVTVSSNAHGLVAGDYVRLTGSTSADGQYFVASATTNAFTVNQAGADETLAAPGRWIPGFVTLPADFAGLINLARNSLVSRANAASLERITLYRAGANAAAGPYGFFYHVRAVPQVGATAQPVTRLELFPTPTAAETAFAIGEYRRHVPILSSDSAVPDIGVDGVLYVALKTLCRAMAISTEEERAGEDWRRYADLITKCAERDGDQQSDLGPLEGGVNDEWWRGTDPLYPNRISPA